MKISRTALNTTLKAINNKFDHITIYDKTDVMNENPVEFTVNWGCFGAVTPDEADKYARQLQEAATVARDFNRLELELVYTDSEVLGDNDWTRNFLEHMNRENCPATFIVDEIEFVIAKAESEGKLF